MTTKRRAWLSGIYKVGKSKTRENRRLGRALSPSPSPHHHARAREKSKIGRPRRRSECKTRGCATITREPCRDAKSLAFAICRVYIYICVRCLWDQGQRALTRAHSVRETDTRDRDTRPNTDWIFSCCVYVFVALAAFFFLTN